MGQLTMSSIDIANQFIRRHGSAIGLTNLKLNKLVYYAQVESIRRRDRALFDGRIEAWQYGPVEPDVYHEFKSFGSCEIARPSGRGQGGRMPGYVASIVDDVAETYGSLSAFDLVELSHRPGGAWSNAYDSRRDNAITVEDIRASEDMAGFDGVGLTLAGAIDSAMESMPNALRLLGNS